MIVSSHAIALGGLIVLMVCGCARPVVTTTSQQVVDGMAVTLITNTPHTGDNTFSVKLADDSTQTLVGNANLSATADMLSPRLPGSPVSGRAQGNGIYNIPVRLGVAAQYDLIIEIERPGHPAAYVTFPIEAAQ